VELNRELWLGWGVVGVSVKRKQIMMKKEDNAFVVEDINQLLFE
jgi:hypothetical protein